MAGRITAVVSLEGSAPQEVALESGDSVAASIMELKARASDIFNAYLNKHHMDTAEVDILEETVSDGEDEAKAPAQEGGRKRKQQPQRRSNALGKRSR